MVKILSKLGNKYYGCHENLMFEVRVGEGKGLEEHTLDTVDDKPIKMLMLYDQYTKFTGNPMMPSENVHFKYHAIYKDNEWNNIAYEAIDIVREIVEFINRIESIRGI